MLPFASSTALIVCDPGDSGPIALSTMLLKYVFAFSAVLKDHDVVYTSST
jgi:hypothetical protein